MAQRSKLALTIPTFHIGVPVEVLAAQLPIQLPAQEPGKAPDFLLRPLAPSGRVRRWSFWFLALTWPTPGYCSHWRADGRWICLSLFLPNKQIFIQTNEETHLACMGRWEWNE